MRDAVAVLVVVALVIVALRMATGLRWYRVGDRRERRDIQAAGESIRAEVPTDRGLQYFTEGRDTFRWGGQEIPKADILSVRLLVSGVPLSTYSSKRAPASTRALSEMPRDPPEAFEGDRWDVGIDLAGDKTVVVECGAIRERVSQELARQIFEVISRDLASRDGA